MPHRDDFDDEDDHFGTQPPPRRPRQGTNPTVIILVVLGCVALVGLVLCGGLFMLGMRAVDAPAQPASKVVVMQPAGGLEPMKRVYTRDEFRMLVMGKTEQEVINELGPPNIADETPDTKRWIYRNRTTIRANGPTDPQVTIRLEGGRVIAVDF